MRKFVSSLKIPVGAFVKSYPNNENAVRFSNFYNVITDLGRNPFSIAVINYDAYSSGEVRIADQPDEIYFGKGWSPMNRSPKWPFGNAIITTNPTITLVASVADGCAIYFHDTAETFVGTAILNTFTIADQDLIEKIIRATKAYCKPQDLVVELSPHACPLHIHLQYDTAVRFFDHDSLEDDGREFVKINLRKEITKRFTDAGVDPKNVIPIYQDQFMCSYCAKDEKGEYMWDSSSRSKRFDKGKMINPTEYDILLSWISKDANN